ncbi:hypothetical protein WJX81_008220 [Elliptochloris bilobata]|uniref:F-box domain-containing protein n=1 Tax=Elliptochloris bilobata TaxID=381761 RepID=A0AAW1RCC7_9CHLO
MALRYAAFLALFFVMSSLAAEVPQKVTVAVNATVLPVIGSAANATVVVQTLPVGHSAVSSSATGAALANPVEAPAAAPSQPALAPQAEYNMVAQAAAARSLRRCVSAAGSIMGGPIDYPMRITEPLALLAPPNVTKSLIAVANIVEEGIVASIVEPLSIVEQGIIGPRNIIEAPWLTLYGLRLRPGGRKALEVELAPIQQLLPEEMLALVLSHLPSAYALGAVACVCRGWRSAAQNPALWRAACARTFSELQHDELARLVRLSHRGSWRAMFKERPHIRMDGIYVSRNTYIRLGATEWRVKNPVHLVCYYRYLRFLPGGRFLYRTSPQPLREVARSLLRPPPARGRAADDFTQRGRFFLRGERVFTSLTMANAGTTEVRTRLRLRSTTPGANNRLDIAAIVSFDSGAGVATPMFDDRDAAAEEEAAGAPGVRSHRRGMSPYVFVPLHRVEDHELNLPVSKMDFYIPS